MIAFISGNLVMNILLIYHRPKTRHCWINAEAERWLLRRSQQPNTNPAQWRRTAQRTVFWVPSLIALSAFLFFPEVLGIASHLFNSQSVGRYRLEIPLTWIIVENTNSYLWVVAGKGMWRTDRD